MLNIDNSFELHSQCYYSIRQRTILVERPHDLLQSPIPDKMKEVFTFNKRMNNYKDYVFTFVYYFEVPIDNKGSERTIHNIKVKQKESGQF